MWVMRTGDPSTTLGAMLSTNPDGQNNSAIEFFYSKTANGVGVWFYNGGSTNTLFTSGTDLPLNTWQHLALVRSGGTTKLYQDGVETGTSGDSVTTLDANTSVGIAVYKNGSGNFAEYFPGYIDEVKIYKGFAKYTSAFSVDIRANYTLPPDAPTLTIENKYYSTLKEYTVNMTSDNSRMALTGSN